MGLLSALYGLALKCRKFGYNHFVKTNKLPAKVICIGNITLGGTGKTPAVIAVAKEATKRGYNPCVLTRGYKGKAKEISFVSRGDGPLLSPREAGDEACLMADTLKRVPIIKGGNRFRAGMAAFNDAAIGNLQSPTLFILDDGFQHWKLHRDIDVLLIDATNPFGNEKLFPEGIMREPFEALERAHVIVITKADTAAPGAIQDITQKIKEYNNEVRIFHASHRPVGLVNITGEVIGLDSLCNKDISAFSGIANPSYFQSGLVGCGARILNFNKFRDHHIYKQPEINEMRKAAKGLDIITTEKDMVKLKDLDIPENLWALKIEFTIDDAFYDTIYSLIAD